LRGQLQSTTRRLNKHWQSGGGGHVTPTIDFITVSGPHIPSGLDVKFQAINLPRQFTRGFRPTDDKPNIEFILRPFSAFYEQPGVPSSHRDRAVPNIYVYAEGPSSGLRLIFRYRGNTYTGTGRRSVPDTWARYDSYDRHGTKVGYGPVSAGGYIIFTADLRDVFEVQTLSQLQENVYLTGILPATGQYARTPFDYEYAPSDNPSNTTVNYSLAGRLVA